MAVSEAEFLANPEVLLARGEQVPAHWLHRAWQEHPTFRDDVTYYLARSVSKVGSFDLAGDVWLQILPNALSEEEAATLYSQILEQSERLEFEWRPAFVAAFPASERLLPKTHDLEIVRATLEQQILSGHGLGFEMLVESLASMPGGVEALREPNVDGETLLQMSERLDRQVMSAILKESLALRSGTV